MTNFERITASPEALADALDVRAYRTMSSFRHHCLSQKDETACECHDNFAKRRACFINWLKRETVAGARGDECGH